MKTTEKSILNHSAALPARAEKAYLPRALACFRFPAGGSLESLREFNIIEGEAEMKAIIHTTYGPPELLQFKEVDKPTPQANAVLIKVHAASVNAAEWHIIRGTPFPVRFMVGGVRKPQTPIPGADVAGVIEAIGSAVKQFEPGDAVYGDLSGCGWGAFAEYVCAPEHALALKPANLDFAQAAAVPLAAVTALQGLRNKGQLQAGQKVLINGASGGVGTFAVQIAKALGAAVTAVCSTRNVERIRALGADCVIDYTQEDFTQNGQQYDLILGTNGYHPISAYKRALQPKGIYVTTGGTMRQMMEAMLLGPLFSLTGQKKLGNLLARPNQQDLAFLKTLLEAGQVKPVIDRCYPLRDVPKAIQYMEEGHAQGKVVIMVNP